MKQIIYENIKQAPLFEEFVHPENNYLGKVK